MSVILVVGVVYLLGGIFGWYFRNLVGGPYPSPEAAQAAMDALARHEHVEREVIGTSTEGRAICAYRIRGSNQAVNQPRLLITAQIHAVEFIGSFVARGIATRLAEGFGRDTEITRLLERADVWVVPLLNPDGAMRVWRRAGWGGLGWSRFTANGVDPNRNFPFVAGTAGGAWNAASDKPGSAYYRGPKPLSEPECLALARLCRRERFCGAINFHSFGGVVFMPNPKEASPVAARCLAVFQGEFQSRQRSLRYRPVPERTSALLGQLDSFLLAGIGTPSVTVEVSRPGLHLLWPWNLFNVFWWANPANPRRWLDNDREAAIHALRCLLDLSGGAPDEPTHPELVDVVPEV